MKLFIKQIKLLLVILSVTILFFLRYTFLINQIAIAENLPSNTFLNKKYEIANKELEDGHWKKAIALLEEIENCCPFSLYEQKVKLDLIYAYYRSNNTSIALRRIDRFIQINPTYPNNDYLIYMHGIINMKMDKNILYKIFGLEYSNRDLKHEHAAFKDFLRLLHNYPKSKYVIDATKRLIFLKNRFAKYEYSIADYYFKRGAWIAVVNRVENMLRRYPDTSATKDGLKLMEKAYLQMQMKKQANKVKKIIVANDNRNEKVLFF